MSHEYGNKYNWNLMSNAEQLSTLVNAHTYYDASRKTATSNINDILKASQINITMQNNLVAKRTNETFSIRI